MSPPPGSILVAPLAGHAARAAFRIDRPGRSCQRLIWGRHLKPLYGVIIVNPEQAWSFRSVPPGRGSNMRNFFAEPVEKATDSKASSCFCTAPHAGAG